MNRSALVKSLVLLLVGFWTASPVSQAAAWDIEIVQDPSQQILGVTSLAYDSAGNPSIAYGDGAADEVRFAVRAGGSWSTELVEPVTMAVLELVYDPNGNPSVAFASSRSGAGHAVFATSGAFSSRLIKISTENGPAMEPGSKRRAHARCKPAGRDNAES